MSNGSTKSRFENSLVKSANRLAKLLTEKFCFFAQDFCFCDSVASCLILAVAVNGVHANGEDATDLMNLVSESIFCAPAYAKDNFNQRIVNENVPSVLKDLSFADFMGTDSLSFFGASLEAAMNSYFVERFNFRQYAFSVTDDGFTKILLRLPRLKPGRPFVNLVFALDRSGKIIRSSLSIKRRYIEDKIHGAFARDYAKSFVQAAVSLKSLEQVESLANEILYRQEIRKENSKPLPSSSRIEPVVDVLKVADIYITGAGGESPKTPLIPKHHSQMYRCFIGKTKVSKLKLHDAVLGFSNEFMSGEETLVIKVEANGFEHKNEADNVDFENLPMHVPAR